MLPKCCLNMHEKAMPSSHPTFSGLLAAAVQLLPCAVLARAGQGACRTVTQPDAHRSIQVGIVGILLMDGRSIAIHLFYHLIIARLAGANCIRQGTQPNNLVSDTILSAHHSACGCLVTTRPISQASTFDIMLLFAVHLERHLQGGACARSCALEAIRLLP